MKKIQRLLRITRTIFVLVLVPTFLCLNVSEGLSASKRHHVSVSKKKTSKKHSKKSHCKAKRSYFPDLTRQQAIDMIRSNSESISELAGLEAMPQDAVVVNQNQNLDMPYEGEDIEELKREDDVTVDMDSFKMLWLSYVDGDEEDGATDGGVSKKEIMGVIMDWLGTPYYFGGMTDKGIDCSAFVRRVFFESTNILLPRTASEQFDVGEKIDREKLKFGDMVFFHTMRHAYASHVGIYLGDNLFAHSSSRFGVTVSSLESTYYNNRFIGGRRLSENDILKLSMSGSKNAMTIH